MNSIYLRLRRRAGRVKRWVKRRWHDRLVGREYRAWLQDSMSRPVATVDNALRIAVVVPVYNPPVEYLREALESVLRQTASNWQLIVSDDGSTDDGVRAYLDKFTAACADDPRVVVVRADNGGISAAMNRGVEQVDAPYFGWLDHDDRLNPRAIELAAAALRPSEGVIDIVYSDEDKIDAKGRHFELYAKPDFSPELLLTQMYLCHFTAFRTELVREVGGFRSGMDGAQDYDLALRLLPIARRVEHIPHPLYHWRAWSESTALTIEAKPWAQEATARAQRDHLARAFGGGTVAPSPTPGLNEVHPRVAEPRKVSVIIPTIGTVNERGDARFVDDAVRSLIQGETQTQLEIIVLTTGVLPEVRPESRGEHELRHAVYSAPEFNFAQAVNAGRAAATGDYLLLLNDDTTVAGPNPVTRMLELAQIDEVGIVGCKLTYPDGRLQHVGMVLLPSGPTHPFIGRPAKEPGYFGSTLTPRNMLAVTAAAMLVRTKVFDSLDGFDEAFARDFNDVDFCLRAHRAGHRIAWTPYAHFTHFEGATMARRKADPAEAALFRQRWGRVYPVDPYYSPALHQDLSRLYEPV